MNKLIKNYKIIIIVIELFFCVGLFLMVFNIIEELVFRINYIRISLAFVLLIFSFGTIFLICFIINSINNSFGKISKDNNLIEKDIIKIKKEKDLKYFFDERVNK